MALMRSATRSAAMAGPGRRLGHDVTMRHLRGAARATAGANSAPANPSVPPSTSRRRVILVMIVFLLLAPPSPPGVKMVDRTVAGADRKPVGRGDRERHVG